MGITKKTPAAGLERDFAPYLRDENAAEYLRLVTDREGFGMRAAYHLEIINLLTQNDKTLLKRIPQETNGGLAEGGRKNVEASFVARANERAVRPEPRGAGEEGEDEIDPLFARWDRQEAALEAWARAGGCWFDNMPEAAAEQYGESIDHGTEATVYRLDGTHVAKVLSCPFDIQESLDRITLTNFFFPETGLRLLGLGRNADGEFCLLVSQPFIQGKAPEQEVIDIKGLEDFQPVSKYLVNPDYATPLYLLGDLHSRNIIIDEGGEPHVIDCNVFLNTPDKNRRGQWVIPPVRSDEKTLAQIDTIVSDLIPRTTGRLTTERAVNRLVPDFSEQIEKAGRYEGLVRLPLTDGTIHEFVFQKDPSNPDRLLYNDPRKIQRLLRYDKRFDKAAQEALADGKTVTRKGRSYRYDLAKGRVIEKTSKKLNLTVKNGPSI